jgi:hypothetical protein
MSELRRKAVPGIVGVFCLIIAIFLLTESSNTYDLSEWQSEEVLMNSAKVSAEGDIFANDRSRQLDESVREGSNVDVNTGSDKGDSAVFAKVSEDSWVRHAVAGLASEELPDLESELARNKPVTRYELAVIVARVIEKLQNGQSGDVVEASYPKIAMLEKLSVEFRQELDILGVSSRRFNARISKVEQRVESMDRSLKVLGQQIDKVSTESSKIAAESRKTVATADASKSDIELLNDMVRQQAIQAESGEKQLKNMGRIISRLLVKVALNDARLKSVTPDGVEQSRRDLGSLAKAISGMQKKVELIDGRTMACDQRVDALSRNMVDKQPAQVSPQALAGIKGLLKDFFTNYETRLRSVEQKAL